MIGVKLQDIKDNSRELMIYHKVLFNVNSKRLDELMENGPNVGIEIAGKNKVQQDECYMERRGSGCKMDDISKG